MYIPLSFISPTGNLPIGTKYNLSFIMCYCVLSNLIFLTWILQNFIVACSIVKITESVPRYQFYFSFRSPFINPCKRLKIYKKQNAYTRVGWKVRRLTMMQHIWSNLTNCVFFQHSLPCGPHTSSISVADLGFLWYRSSHSDPQKSPQLQIWPHHQSDTASQPIVFSCWGTKK